MMYEIIIEDLKKFIEIFWKRDDIDIRNFDCYKGCAYILMQLYKKIDYHERKDELLLYMKHNSDEWQFYFVNLMLELMMEDNSIPTYEKTNLRLCKFKSDIPNAIRQIKKCHNAFVLAGDLATDIYQNTIKSFKELRKERVLSKLSVYYSDDYENLYSRLEKHENILNELYKASVNTHMPNTYNYPFEVKRLYELEKCKYRCQLYILWLEYEEDKSSFMTRYDNVRRQCSEISNANLIARLKIIHKMIASNIYEQVKVIKAWDRDTACELGCPSEEYVSSDWESDVAFNKDFNKFISNCSIGRCACYKFIIIDNKRTFKITISNDD